MRRQTFLHALGGLAATALLPSVARSATALKLMIPANPGGGWDSTGRALGRAIVEAQGADAVEYENKGGAAGAIGLAQFITTSRGDPDALIMTGAVMLGGLIGSKSPLKIQSCTPIARLTSEYNVFVVEANSPIRTMKDVVDRLQKDPASVKWGGGSRGSTEHIAACMLARQIKLDPKKINYVAFKGGGEAAAAILGGTVTVGGGGLSELAEHIASGKMRALGVTSQKRLPGVNLPTLKEQGYDVVLGNWRGVYAAPAITPERRAALTDIVTRATKTKAWQEALAKNGWTSSFTSGKDFEDFVEFEYASISAIMYLSGMV
jgi:putative tricarboxylic transport membrane protein